jgi:hypothetical protein
LVVRCIRTLPWRHTRSLNPRCNRMRCRTRANLWPDFEMTRRPMCQTIV